MDAIAPNSDPKGLYWTTSPYAYGEGWTLSNPSRTSAQLWRGVIIRELQEPRAHQGLRVGLQGLQQRAPVRRVAEGELRPA